MKKILIAVAVITAVVSMADVAWDTVSGEKAAKDAVIEVGTGGKGAVTLTGIPVAPGKRYRLHYTAEGVGETGGVSLFHNLLMAPEPRVEGTFMVQDVRNAPQKAFQNFKVPAHVRYNRIDITFSLKTRNGSVKITDLRLEEIQEDVRDTWEINIIHPAYRQTFYAGEKNRELKVEVVGEKVWHDSELLDKDGTCVAATKGLGGVFTMDLSKLPYGNYELISLVTGPSSIQKIIKKQITLAPPAEMEVIAGKNHYFYINGKPFFPVFYFFEMVEDGLLYEASRNGVNICIMGFNAEAHMLRELDRFHKFGIKGVIYLEQYRHIYSPDRFDEFKERFAERVTKKVMNHPAFFGYLISDEPFWKGLPVERIGEYYRFVKAADPYHPIWINEAPRNEIADLRMYAEYADIYGVDIYPIPYPNGHSNLPNKLPSVVGDYTRRYTEVVRGRKPVWMCLQGNSWSDYGLPRKLQRYPSYEENRFMAFDAMTSGSHGYALYSPEHIKNYKFQQNLFAVSRELQSLSGLFINAERLADAEVSNSAVRCALYSFEGNIYGICVNTSIEPQTASVKLPEGAQMKVVGSDVVLDPAKLSLKPLEVVVWGKAPLPPSCWQQIQKNEQLDGESHFQKQIERRRNSCFERWKKAGITPPEEPAY